MKALTLHQPWATAMAIGLKRIETRGWSTRYRGPVVIHSAQKCTREMVVDFNARMRAHPEDRAAFVAADFRFFTELPFGQSLAVADLVNVVPVRAFVHGAGDEQEERWGDYSAGRFAWIFANLRRLERPRHVSGAQGLGEWRHGDLEVPASVHGSTPSASTASAFPASPRDPEKSA